MILLNPTFLYLPLMALLVSAHAWWRKRREYLVPSLWLWILVLMFNFGSSSSTGYVPLALFNRYLFPIFLPAIIVVAGFLADSLLPAHGRPGRLTRAAGVLAAGVALWFGGSDLARNLRTPPTWLTEVRAVSDEIPAGTTLYSDAITLRALEFFRGYPAVDRWIDLSAVASPDGMSAGSLVLVNPAGINWLDVNAGMWVAWPEPGPTDRGGYLRGHFYRSPPDVWQPIWQEGDVRLYKVASTQGPGAGSAGR
jgi:hypothetical protein